jgi:hypothetical protein
MAFVPHLFISVGETHAYFTLRETYLHTSYVRGPGSLGNCVLNGVYRGSVFTEVRSHHIKNLSQDSVEAISKAKEYADLVGMPLKSSLDEIEMEMRQIKRATAEQLEVRARKMREMEIANRDSYIESKELKLNALYAGYLPFGGMDIRGLHIRKAPLSYINWIVDNQEKTEKYSILWIAAEVIKEQYADLLLPKADPTVHVGVEGERQTFDVICTKVTGFARPGYMGGTEYIVVTTMIDKKTNGSMVVFSNKFNALSVGQEAKIKATVKKHDAYAGAAQTTLTRVNVI